MAPCTMQVLHDFDVICYCLICIDLLVVVQERWTPMHHAAWCGRLQVVHTLLAAEAPVNATTEVSIRYSHQRAQPLDGCCVHGR
jgi:hypothetical protein